jgi:hypothetical protein
MDITAYITGIAHPQRMTWLRETVDYMDTQNFPFKEKILAIDQFNGHFVKPEEVKYYEGNGWKVLLDSHKSRSKTFDRVLREINTEFVFYNEDDVMATMPKIEDIKKVFNLTIEDRKCGMISMTLGGTQFAPERNFIGDLNFINQNIILESDGYIIFRRMESFKNDYFFEFPGLWIRTEILRNCHNKAKMFRGQIEEALTKGYIDNKYIETHFKCSIAKKDAQNILWDNPMKVNTHCRLLSNLDPRQGSSAVGGNHMY